MHTHASVSEWQREEDGSYKATLNGRTLHVKWHPESESPRGGGQGQGRGFSWEVASDAGPSQKSDELYEEIEVAMAQAERIATAQPA